MNALQTRSIGAATAAQQLGQRTQGLIGTTRRSTPSRIATKTMAVAQPIAPKGSSNGGGPDRLMTVHTSLEEINRAIAACIKQAAKMSSIEKINKGIGKEISKAAQKRARSSRK
ncbi:hypothetical protein Agub_g10445 [Astrephomene gubernaculifera]|uniref:Uncharacterized protein n=1 Tax=Astrephomene gubernaculifera TaxID=47775 RepID=A0AAD3HPU8_9CHLO|nr:hypothetical protein Agub_g10445 [Astrephomene gubernaculifera]